MQLSEKEKRQVREALREESRRMAAFQGNELEYIKREIAEDYLEGRPKRSRYVKILDRVADYKLLIWGVIAGVFLALLLSNVGVDEDAVSGILIFVGITAAIAYYCGKGAGKSEERVDRAIKKARKKRENK